MSLVWHHCVLKVAHKDPQTMEEERKHRIECDGACHTTETAEHKEHRLSNPRTKDKARHAACTAAEVVLSSHTQIIAPEL